MKQQNMRSEIKIIRLKYYGGTYNFSTVCNAVNRSFKKLTQIQITYNNKLSSYN